MNKFENIVFQRNRIVLGVNNPHKKDPIANRWGELFTASLSWLSESANKRFCHYCISAFEGNYEVKNTMKIAAIVTLVSTDDGFKSSSHLLFELLRLF